jgi:hypothetical protein
MMKVWRRKNVTNNPFTVSGEVNDEMDHSISKGLDKSKPLE